MKDLIRVTSVFGIEGEQLATVTAGLVRGFGFTEDQVGGLADKLYMVGKQFDAGQESIQAWPAIFEALNGELADFGKNMKPEDIEKLTLSIVQLGGGLSKSLGIPAQAAMETARTAFTTLAGERKNIINMFRGKGGAFGEIAQQLMETGGDTNKMFEMMMEGDPVKFMDTLREMADVAKTQGGETGMAFQRLSQTMATALGPDVAFLAKGSWDDVQETMAKIPDVIAGGKARGALADAAKLHHKTGLTAGESWDRTVQGMKARLYKLTDKEMGGWQKNMKRGFEDTFTVVSKLAKADGPVGELTKRFLAVQRVGLSALIPGLESMAPMLGGIASSAAPMMTALGSMGLKFGSLGKMALGGGAIWMLFEMLQKGPKEAIASITSFGKDVWATLGELFPEMEKKAKEYFEYIKSGDLFGDIKKQLDKIDFEGAFSAAGEILNSLLTSIGTMLSKVDWGSIVRKAFSAIMRVAASLGGFVMALLGGSSVDDSVSELEGPMTASIGTMFVKVMYGVKNLAMNALSGFWDEIFSAKSLGEAFDKIKGAVIGGLGVLLVLSKGFRGKALSGIKSLMSSSVSAVNGGMRGMASAAGRGMMKVGRAIKTGLKAAGPLMAIMAIIEGINQAKIRAEEAAKIMSDTTISESQKAALASEKAFLGVLSTIDSVFLGIPSSIGSALGVTMDDLSSFYHDMVAGFETGISAMVEFFSLSFNNVKRYLVMFGDVFVGVWNWLGSAAQGIVGEIMLVWKKATTFLELKLNEMGKNIETTFMAIGQYIMYPFKLLGHKLKGWMSELLESILGTSGSPTVFGNLLKKFDSGMFDSMLKTVRTMRVEYKMEGGEQFDKKYFEESEKQRKAVANRYEQAAKKLKDELTADETRAAITAAKVEASQKAASREISDALVSAARDTTDNYDRANKNVIQYSEDAYRGAAEAAETSKRLRDEATKEEGFGVDEKVAEASAKPKPKRAKAMSPTERAELAKPKDPGVRALMENVSTLTSGMSQFVQKPLNVSVNVQGDIGKFMRFNAQHERKNMPSTVAR